MENIKLQLVAFLIFASQILQAQTISYQKVNESDSALVRFTLKNYSLSNPLSKFYFDLDSSQRHILQSVNRMDEQHLLRKSKLWIPENLSNASLWYAPFDERNTQLDSFPKAVLISLKIQAFALYEYGRLVRWGAVCTGKKSTPTPSGLHYMTFKKKIKVSTINKNWIMPWYFNIDVVRGIALHQYQLPGYPASHACIRLQEADAKYIYSWGNQWRYKGNKLARKGTPVLIYGKFPFQAITNNYMFNNEISELEQSQIELQIKKLNNTLKRTQ